MDAVQATGRLTKMTNSSFAERRARHESDFYGWTQEQADILRGMAGTETRLDVANWEEEIEDLGRTELRGIARLLKRAVAHLIKLVLEPESQARDHWFEEAVAFQGDAAAICSPEAKQRIDVEKIWRLASNEALRILENRGTSTPELPAVCPLSLDELLVEDFDPKDAIRSLASAIYPANRPAV